jgi:hypothetical protein
MMADNQLNDDVGGDDIFVYTGGEQQVPRDVKRVRIAENIDTIPESTFQGCEQLLEVEGHNKIKKIEEAAFYECPCLRSVTKMGGVVEIEQLAFGDCSALSDVDFDKLEIVGEYAFGFCESLRSINMPSVRRVVKSAFSNCVELRSINMPSIRRVGNSAFQNCVELTDAVFGKDLERIEGYALAGCGALKRIVTPLKDNLFVGDEAFYLCINLSRVDILAGDIHRTISSLHMESWRDEMEEEIDRINQTLPNIRANLKTRAIREWPKPGSDEKAQAIQQWITRVFSRMEHYKTEHQILLKEAMALLELALWKAKLLNETDEKKCSNVTVVTKKAKIDVQSVRKEHRVTCGASAVIKNVLPFLALK